MTPKISVDDQTLDRLRNAGELQVEGPHGVPVILMTVDARQELEKRVYDDSEWTASEMRAIVQPWLNDPEGWGLPGWKSTTTCTETNPQIMPKVRRGDVVIVNFAQGKARPALVVQSDINNGRLVNTILVQVSSNTRLAGKEPTQVLIDVTTADGKQSGLKTTSAVKCENIASQPITDIRHVIGHLPDSLMQQVDAALKASLELP